GGGGGAGGGGSVARVLGRRSAVPQSRFRAHAPHAGAARAAGWNDVPFRHRRHRVGARAGSSRGGRKERVDRRRCKRRPAVSRRRAPRRVEHLARPDSPRRRGTAVRQPREADADAPPGSNSRGARCHAHPVHPRRNSVTEARSQDRRWLALLILCLGDLMIVLDVTIVGVALPSIRADLGFSEESLAWVVNAYLITFGGFLLLGGRLGDLFGHRTLFVIGVAVFTTASAACGFAGSQGMLIAARAVQGVGGAIVSAVALSLMMTLFLEPAERAKAMGIFGFVASGARSLGVLLGGILPDVLNWPWIFLVNLPVGILVVVLTLVVISGTRVTTAMHRLDIAGAVTVTASLVIAVYSIVNGNKVGWLSGRTLGL